MKLPHVGTAPTPLTREQRRRLSAADVQQRRRHGMDARQLFVHLRERLLASRPVETVAHPHWKDSRGRPLKVRVFGKPTFENRFDEKGRHV